jgi:hypothetical protein
MSLHITRKSMSAIKSTWNPRVEFDPWGNAINPTQGWAPFSRHYLPLLAVTHPLMYIVFR